MTDRPARRKPARRRPRQDALGRWLCTKCKHHKPAEEYYIVKSTGKPHSWCKACVIIDGRERIAGPDRERRRAWLQSPETRERNNRRQRERKERRRVSCMKYRNTPRGKLVDARSDMKSRIAGTADPERRALLEAKLATIELELSRMESRTLIIDEPEEHHP